MEGSVRTNATGFPGRFRVWDADIKKFYKGADILREPNNPKTLFVAPLPFAQISWSTGLFDKNGKEIFEGDVLRHGHYLLEPCIVFWEQGLVGFKLSSVGGIRGQEHLLDLSGPNDLGYILWDVIGNIYEMQFEDLNLNRAIEQWKEENKGTEKD